MILNSDMKEGCYLLGLLKSPTAVVGMFSHLLLGALVWSSPDSIHPENESAVCHQVGEVACSCMQM